MCSQADNDLTLQIEDIPDGPVKRRESSENPVDGHSVPVPHFGVVLEMDHWKALTCDLEKAAIAFGFADVLQMLNLLRATRQAYPGVISNQYQL
jgi:extradiol dioxygenase family protein